MIARSPLLLLPILAASLAAQPTRVEESNQAVVRGGAWTSVNDAAASGGTYLESNTPNSTLTFNFTGDSIAILRRLNNDGGMVTVTIDGNPRGELTFDHPQVASVVPAVFDNLGAGAHILVLTVSADRPSIRAGTTVWIDAFDTPAGFAPSAEQQTALTRYNQVRAQMGFPAVRLSAPLSLAAQAHTDYLTQNNATGSGEQLGIGFTGFFAPNRITYFGYPSTQAARENTAALADPTRAVDFWMSTIYQRLEMAAYSVTEIGYGLSRLTGRTADGILLSIRGSANPAARVIATYPLDRQTDVPVNFTEDGQNPLPNVPRPLGYPISIHITPVGARGNQRVAPTGTLTGPNNQVVPVRLVSEATDPSSQICDGNTVFMVPLQPLAPGTLYTARITGADGSLNLYDQTWSFTTAGAGTPVTPPVTPPVITGTPRQYRFSMRGFQGGLLTAQADGTLTAPAANPPADGNGVTAAQQFLVTDLNGGEIVREDPVTIQAANGNFLTFAAAAPNTATATATAAGANERFLIAGTGNGFSFKAANNLYLSAQMDGRLLANGAQPGASEAFFSFGGPVATPPPGPGAAPAGAFQPINGVLTNISVGFDGMMMGANAQLQIYVRTGDTWRRVENGAAPLIAVVSAQRVFAAIPGRLFWCNTVWDEIPMPAGGGITFVWISAASDGTLVAVDDGGDIYRRDAQTGAWRTLGGGSYVRVAARSATEYWALQRGGTIQRSVDGGPLTTIPNGLLLDVSVSSTGEVWGIGLDQMVYRYNGTGFERMSQIPMSQVSIGNATNIWAITPTGLTHQWR